MTAITSISVEILRHGPPHGHLLSPLTQYLARTGDHALTISFPYEHRQLLSKLSDLRYANDEQSREDAIEEVGQKIGDILRSIPDFFKLDAETSRFIHLEIELSASELAMIPFELSDMPTGEGGLRARLALQTGMPVSVTRRVRGMSGATAHWPVRPRVLFAWSEKGGEVPHAQHGRALKKALETWRDPWADRSVLWELKNASLKKIKAWNARHHYTHVHVLAHGDTKKTRGQEFALLLDKEIDDDGEPEEVVDGWRLASALCLRNTRPAIVSLAACDSGNVGSVHDRTGASIAHSLHQQGVSLVVASQFPLTTSGSVVMAQELYGGLFDGTDPRVVLHDVRTALHRHSATDHDWGSVVAYAAFPRDLEPRLEETRWQLARLADSRAYKTIEDKVAEGSPGPNWGKLEDRLKTAIGRYPTVGRYAAEGTGMRGSAFKRLAWAAFLFSGGGRNEDRMDDCIRYLEESRDNYADAARMFMTPRVEDGPQSMTSLHWVLTQQLSLRAVLGQDISPELWWASWANAKAHLERDQGSDGTWAYASFAELCLLQLSMPVRKRVSDLDLPAGDWGSRAVQFAKGMLGQEADPGSWRITAARGAFRRYTKEWWMSKPFVAHLARRGIKRRPNWNDSGLTLAANRVAGALQRR